MQKFGFNHSLYEMVLFKFVTCCFLLNEIFNIRYAGKEKLGYNLQFNKEHGLQCDMMFRKIKVPNHDHIEIHFRQFDAFHSVRGGRMLGVDSCCIQSTAVSVNGPLVANSVLSNTPCMYECI